MAAHLIWPARVVVLAQVGSMVGKNVGYSCTGLRVGSSLGRGKSAVGVGGVVRSSTGNSSVSVGAAEGEAGLGDGDDVLGTYHGGVGAAVSLDAKDGERRIVGVGGVVFPSTSSSISNCCSSRLPPLLRSSLNSRPGGAIGKFFVTKGREKDKV